MTVKVFEGGRTKDEVGRLFTFAVIVTCLKSEPESVLLESRISVISSIFHLVLNPERKTE